MDAPTPSPDPLEDLDPDTSAPEQTHARYKLYQSILEKGRQLVADLNDATKVRGVHPPLDDKYKIVHKPYRSTARPLNQEPVAYLRRENVDTNGLSYCEVSSIPPWKDNHCALVKITPQSGEFVANELEERQNTSSQPTNLVHCKIAGPSST